MSDILQNLLTRAEPRQEAEWPQWIANAVAHKPESGARAADSPTKKVTPDTGERRNIRVLTRVSNT